MRIDDNKEALAMMRRALGSLEGKIREAYNKGYRDGLKHMPDTFVADGIRFYKIKDESNSSEKPNNSTKPTISKMEQVDKDINVRSKDEPQRDCLTCRYNSDEWDSPKCDGCSKAYSNYEPKTDCAWK